MPLYEYACQVCGLTVECLVSREGDVPQECGSCGGGLSRVLSATKASIGGVDGKQRTAQLLQHRNSAYAQSSRGKEERRAQIAALRKRGMPV